MDNAKKISIALILIAIALGLFGIWLKTYNDRITEEQINESGSCYLQDGTCLHATSDMILYSMFAISVFLAALGFYLGTRVPAKSAGTEHPVKKSEIEMPKSLSPEAKQVYDFIAQSNGAVLQGEIIAKTGMNKVKVSRVLDKLEMLGIIERRRHGMSNMVVLKKSS